MNSIQCSSIINSSNNVQHVAIAFAQLFTSRAITWHGLKLNGPSAVPAIVVETDVHKPAGYSIQSDAAADLYFCRHATLHWLALWGLIEATGVAYAGLLGSAGMPSTLGIQPAPWDQMARASEPLELRLHAGRVLLLSSCARLAHQPMPAAFVA